MIVIPGLYLIEFNRMRMKNVLLIFAVGLMLGLSACSDDATIGNPYDDQPAKEHHDKVGTDTVLPGPITIQNLQKLIFEPTCANSGCHDGLFEPDFRTVESSYNSLINRAIIKQDTSDPQIFRVVPGNSSKSMLLKRLLVDINGNSGKMPILVDPGSDWLSKKDEYIDLVKQWIDSGALDQHGNPPPPLDYPPVLVGVAGYLNGSLIKRPRFQDPMEVPEGTGNVEIWFAYTDDKTPLSDLGTLEVYTSKNPRDYSGATATSMSYTSAFKTENGFSRDPVDFYHKVTLDLSSYVSGEVIWIRTKIDDGNTTLELPGRFSLFTLKTYTAIKIK